MEGTLVLIRHGESEWNARNVWTGLTDVGLTQKGEEEARSAGSLLADIKLDRAYTSALRRAQQTLSIILAERAISGLPVVTSAALNERDYGVYTGKNKLEIKKQLGDTEFLKLRRGWDYPVPQGESLKQVYARVTPYFETVILPQLSAGQRILIVAHGNSLRALMKKLEHISDADIPMVEMATGDVIVYRTSAGGSVISRERRAVAAYSDKKAA